MEWSRQTTLCREPRVRNALGLHPWCLSNLDPQAWRSTLEEAFQTLPGVWGESLVAVGECGLDRSKAELKGCFEQQLEAFKTQLQWAGILELPVIVHSVKATAKTYELLAEFTPKRGGVLHSFSGPREMIPRFLELGMSFSYSGNLSLSEKVRDCLRATPSDRLLWETDGPNGRGFGKVSGPQNLPKVVELASRILGKSVEWCRSVHNENMTGLFRIQEIT